MCTTGNTTDSQIKVGRDYIGDFEFVGIVVIEVHSSQIIDSMKSDMLKSNVLRHAKSHNSTIG